eukprot:CAMPEP_0175514718 /NCGR_PEP_ID=MMETSP0096-20121207/13567_1 /TAXON_ID=311494 /ORGANISM="Alexandrium monilatum, Strain CCMP3105" /LENGTH=130 /DNA_ID=CAMNT_0016816971 /DNA_START=24 /DNA_END=414 /DNA_ORIENTATION=-
MANASAGAATPTVARARRCTHLRNCCPSALSSATPKTSLQRLSRPLDALTHKVSKRVDGGVVKQQGTRKIDAGELLHQLVSKLHHGQAVQASIHKRGVPGQRLDAHQTVGHVVDLQPQHLGVHLIKDPDL